MMQMKKRPVVVMVVAAMLLLWGFGGGAAWGAQQVEAGNAVDFTPSDLNADTVKTWTLPWWLWTYDNVWRDQFVSTCYSYNDHYGNRYRALAPMSAESGAGVGGIVWHFQSSEQVPMGLSITPIHAFGGSGNRTFEVYYSDVNHFSLLEPMSGGTWDAYESNGNWTRLYSDRVEGASATASGALEVETTDGDFWVRIDMSSNEAGGETDVKLTRLTVSGTVLAGIPSVTVAATMNDLCGLSAGDGDGVMVLGYYTVQDGGGGLFYFDADSTAADNGGTIIEPDSGSGRWLRVGTNGIDVKQFGAVGNGVIDDTEAIRSAALYAFNNGYQAVRVPAGTYVINDTIYMTDQQQSFRVPNLLGAGPDVTTFKAGGNFVDGNAMVHYRGGSGAGFCGRVEGIRFEGNGRTDDEVGVCIADNDGMVIENCKFAGLRYGVRFHNMSGFSEMDVVRHCDFDEVGTTLHYLRTGGTESYHGTGMQDCVTRAYAGTPMIEVDDQTGQSYMALIYNAPLDATVYAENGAVLYSSTSTQNMTCYGTLRIVGENVTVATGSGVLNLNGNVMVRGNDMELGNFTCQRITTSYTSGALAGETRSWDNPSVQNYTLVSGTTTLTDSSVADDGAALFYVRISGSSYDYRYLLHVTDYGDGGGHVSKVATIREYNGSNAGAPNFAVNGQGCLQVTNTNYSSGYSMTVYKTPMGSVGYPPSN